ncbi:MAG TPA: HAMP domain-containing sensor histidine kinase [Candidatus Eisenbacteria bacterium]|nr:HAMP domain-containing sensor histidine kinase [Candidatus Eisenbacteria bacterium]
MIPDTRQSSVLELSPRPSFSGNGSVAPSPRVLVVEGNLSETRLIRELLAAIGSFEVWSAPALSAALEQLSGNRPDLVLLNLALPDSRGMETLQRVVAAAPDAAVVVLTAQEHDPLAIEAMQSGAQDYLVKGQVDGPLLARVARHALEKQRLEAELHRRQTEQFDLKDQFLSHISHELRSPLAAIDQFANLLLDNLAGPLAAEQREYLEVVVRNAGQVNRMIDDLLAMVRAQSGKLRVEPIPFSMTRLIKESLQTLGPRAEAKQVALRAEFTPEVPVVWGDPQRTYEVLTNLIENAIKFTPEKGSVTVTARPFAGHSSFVEVAVADTGCGIAADDLDKVFDRLFQVSRRGPSAKGLGLGLYISRELVQRQGGRIWVESAVNHGSTFRFVLPAHTVVGELYSELGRKTPPAGPLSLIELSVQSLRGNAAVPLDAATLESLREFVTGCVRPEVDVVLPPVESGPDAASLFVLAATEPAGAEAVQKRVLAGLSAPDQKLGAEVTLISTATPVAFPFGWTHWPPEQRMQAVAAQVEQMIEQRRVPSAGVAQLGSERAAHTSIVER